VCSELFLVVLSFALDDEVMLLLIKLCQNLAKSLNLLAELWDKIKPR
jgi:hypothetical protein